MRTKLSAVSLFSGCGGFDYGALRAGVDIRWANDIDQSARVGYEALLPDIDFHESDIREVETFPKADILMGCYPCTGFSLGARRRWRSRKTRDLKADPGNFLFLEFLRALRIVKPRFLIIENVTGMTSAEDGWFWQRQQKVYREAGYRLFGPFRLNAVDYGVAQTRKRVFVVGVRKDVDYEYVCPRKSHGPGTPREHKTLRDAIFDMPRWPNGEYCEVSFHGHYLTRNRKRSWNEPSYTIVANEHHVPLHPMGEGMRFVRKDTWALQGGSNRRLSWRECARIQGFPESFEPDLPMNSLYRIIGNAVPWRFGEVLLRPLVSAFT